VITVLAGGCFDVLHVGHIAHLRAARAMGDRLVVALTADEFVNKGPGRPVFNEQARADVLRELRCVDEVIISSEPVPLAVIQAVRPQIYAKGREYAGRLAEQALVESLGGRAAFTDTAVFSSTALLGWL
jgi:rfaE bifunctional protein nucleotidyltransferase chain/domain